MPFVFAKAVVIFGVNYCEFALGQRDFSGGKAVAETAVPEDRCQQDTTEAIGNVNCGFDASPPNSWLVARALWAMREPSIIG